ncbi:hypothetical protein JTE90_011957 [Oedothorax gibbosus]|uniref:PiggyBac transposable element-derived protein domain-containing protein n=1 Tax=Oedothorax gibbosus TaxID=931172 RepID=A0AAV6V0S4_9ARAC|nr:hypothetical protein JTE90_011957 [Oedothorax gibbosus]
MEPMGQAKRWCPKSKKKIDLPQPGIVGSYNKNMSGVDILDRFFEFLPTKNKGKEIVVTFFYQHSKHVCESCLENPSRDEWTHVAISIFTRYCVVFDEIRETGIVANISTWTTHTSKL